MVSRSSSGVRRRPPSTPPLELLRHIRLIAFDFDGVFTDNMVYVLEDGREAVRCFRGDGIGLRKLEREGIEPLIISTETNAVVSARSRKLQIRCIQGCKDKRQAISDLAAERGLTLNQIAFVGNDINDSPALQVVGLPVVVQDAHPDVLPLARWRTVRPGGHGAVREICDTFERLLRTAGSEDQHA